jgi:hypothetical protein
MEWIQPAFFWGLLGISIPLAIHLWNGRRGKVIAWAATAWLNPVESQSSRSLKLDQLLLLLVRMALWTLLVLLVVGLWWKSLGKTDSPNIIHLVMPNAQVEADFRFELEQGLEKGDKVFWLAEGLPEYQTGENPPAGFDPSQLQDYLETFPQNVDSIHWYGLGSESEIPQPTLWLPKTPEIHLASQLTPATLSSQVIQVESGDFLGLNKQGILSSIAEESGISRENSVYSGSIPVYFEVKDEVKKENLSAALGALKEVYGFSFFEREKQTAKVIFSDQAIENPESEKLYFYIEANERSVSKQEIPLSDPVVIPWDEVVEKGILPELILDPLIDFLGILPQEVFLTHVQIQQKFTEIPQSKQARMSNTTELFLILIVLLFALERFLAYRNNL